jgi:3-oxoacyl-[acyl-carrier-protein] synthase-3
VNPRILGCGHATPQRVVTNEEIETELGLGSGWIERRTGVRTRRICGPDEYCSTLAISAGSMALEHARVDASDLGLLLLATSTPDYPLPPTAPAVAAALGTRDCGAVDLAGACAGFLYGLSMAAGWTTMHQAPALVVASNVLSRRLDPSDPTVRAVFADGAGAVVVGPGTDDQGLRSVALGSDGELAASIRVEAGGSVRPIDQLVHEQGAHFLRIHDGPAVFTSAVEGMIRISNLAMDRAGVVPIEIDRWIPHQANRRILNRVGDRLSIESHRWVSILETWGNSSAASLPTAMSVAAHVGGLKPGQKILLSAVGAGMVEAAAVLDWTAPEPGYEQSG